MKMFCKAFCMLIFCLPLLLNAQSKFKLKISVPEFKDSVINLANHYGEKQYYKDTTVLDGNGIGYFEADTMLHPGIYLVVMPSGDYFEAVLGSEDQVFEMYTSGNSMEEYSLNMKIVGSKENSIFYGDIKFLKEQREKIQAAQAKMAEAKDEVAKKAIQAEMKVIDDAVKSRRAKFIAENPKMTYAKVLKSMQPIDFPEAVKKNDTLRYRYYKAHYWDNTDFTGGDLLYSPRFHNMMKDYMKRLTLQHPDSLIKSCDVILKKAEREDTEIFRYALVWLLNEHAGSDIMCLEGVYAHLVNEYYAKGKAPWIEDEQLEKIKKDARNMMNTLCYRTAPNIIIDDLNGKTQQLHALPGEYTILAFWDSGCGHCKKKMPKMYKMWERYKSHGVSAMSISIQLEHDEFVKFIDEKEMGGWINALDTGMTNQFRSYYHIPSTPQIFLLDKNKKIVAKKLSVHQMAGFLDHHLKTNYKDEFPEEKEPEKKDDAPAGDGSNAIENKNNTGH